MDNDPIFSPGDQKVIGQAGLTPSPGMAKRIYFVMMLGLVLLGVWVVLDLRAKSKYDQVKHETELVYTVTPINQEMTAFLTEVQSSWTSKADETDGPESEMIKLAGMTPSVTNLINVLNYQMPPYAWFSSEQNRKAA